MTTAPNRRRRISFPARTRVSALPVTLLSGSSWIVLAMSMAWKSSGARAARTFVPGPLLETKAWRRNAFAVGTVNETSTRLKKTSCARIAKHKRQRQRTDIMKLKLLGDSGISWRPLYKVVVGSICEKQVYVSVFWDGGDKAAICGY